MDFTYFIAGFIGLVVGVLVSAAFVVAKARGPTWRLFAFAFLLTLVLDAILLINWSAVGRMPPAFIALDFGFISLYSLVGCLVGALPALAVRHVWRRWRASCSPQSSV